MSLEVFYYIAAVIGLVADVISIYSYFKDKDNNKGPAVIAMIIGTLILIYGLMGGFNLIPKTDPKSVETDSSQTTVISSFSQHDGIGQVTKGSFIEFGSYPQSSSSYESIKWRVLDVEDDKALLVSVKVLDSVLYGEKINANVTWETSNLRRWINDDFYHNAFSSEEKSMIVPTAIDNPDNPKYHTDGGDPTTDNVFVLSITEAEKYFSSDKDRMAAATQYAKSHGSYTNNEYVLPNGERASWYWLRTPGEENYKAARVYNSGGLDYKGFHVGYSKVSVRPAIWVYM